MGVTVGECRLLPRPVRAEDTRAPEEVTMAGQGWWSLDAVCVVLCEGTGVLLGGRAAYSRCTATKTPTATCRVTQFLCFMTSPRRAAATPSARVAANHAAASRRDQTATTKDDSSWEGVHACVYACLYVCACVCMYVCVYVCL